ncbi:hypothetical protein K501DRAFT_329054 [Backusella circina FSU 941]|nr:hypothetical protein K501DRAFT_329054 [Backusella circina FSU 941]
MAALDIYKILSLLAALGILLSLIGNFVSLFWPSFLNAIFKICLLVVLLLIEFKQTPAFIKYMSFMYSFLGRGFFYIILAFITFNNYVINIVGGILILVPGIAYLVFHFIRRDQEPPYMAFSTYLDIVGGSTLPHSQSSMTHTPPTVMNQTYSTESNHYQGGYNAGSSGPNDIYGNPATSPVQNGQYEYAQKTLSEHHFSVCRLHTKQYLLGSVPSGKVLHGFQITRVDVSYVLCILPESYIIVYKQDSTIPERFFDLCRFFDLA